MGHGYSRDKHLFTKSRSLERLQADHLALFVGIGMPKAVPWGSVYLTEENLLLQRSTHALTAFLKSHRIILCTDEQQISDHIGLCLSVLALLLKQWGDYPEETTERTIREFLRDHLLPWSGRFANCSPPMLKRLYMHY
ncbi:TorD/DmsD family molecular chaperone [Escherichia coli]|uniref:TorD/DmsD family molecular chaperone n=1 Tax=Escherichia coli TaxID=562 RepID=UPI003D89B6D4